MKVIILISSIFYILGLKISNKIDFIKKSNPVDKIITNNIKVDQPFKTFYFINEMKTESDSLKGDSSSDEHLQKCK